ncbi:SRPBCC domain-containing protein [Pedobacter heparinus]|uniref:SRPBCC family protein n=1 Tax=Pedobacter heparinus TaxID=984 RepID=UPI00292E4514|nr:SRPBCC domain-containing protein [Pedobacter heparinus]
MATTNFTTTILVDQTPEQVFEAVNKPRDWWSGEFEGNTTELGDEFTYRYKEFHYSKQKVVELVPNQRVVWLVTESQLNFIEDKQEWTGTKMIFEISEQGDKTKLQFSHIGLHPEVECYNDCSNVWGKLIQKSLYELITTGKAEKPVLA